MLELRSYSEELAIKPHVVVITKADILSPDEAPPKIDAPGAWGQYVISSVAQRGLDPLLEDLWTRVRKEIETEQEYDELEEEYRP
jgi:GTPase